MYTHLLFLYLPSVVIYSMDNWDHGEYSQAPKGGSPDRTKERLLESGMKGRYGADNCKNRKLPLRQLHQRLEPGKSYQSPVDIPQCEVAVEAIKY